MPITINPDKYFFPPDIATTDWIRRTYGPVIRTIRNPVPLGFVHPEEHRCRSLIRSRRDAIHFLLDQLEYNIESRADDDRIRWYIHAHAIGICELINRIRVIRHQVACGVPVEAKDIR